MNTRSSTRNLTAARLSRKASRRRLLAIERLEDRKLLSTFTVNSTLDDGSVGTLRWAVGQVNATPGANTIAFDTTVFSTPKTITLAGTQLELSEAGGTETITGPAAGVTVSGGGLSRVFQVDANVTASISGVTISGGNAIYSYYDGGGLYNLGTTTLTDSSVSGNSASEGGGGLANGSGAKITLTNCTISGNSVTGFIGINGRHRGGRGGGMAATLYSQATMINCIFSNNTAPGGQGGALDFTQSGGSPTNTLVDCTFSGNSVASGEGGALWANDSKLSLANCIFSANSAAEGGGAFLLQSDSDTLTNCTVSGNTATGQSGYHQSGGGLYLGVGNNTTLTNCTVSGNSAFASGGGISTAGAGFGNNTTLIDCTISSNTTGQSGGGISNEGLVGEVITNSTISGNSADQSGGGVTSFIRGSVICQPTISNTILAENTAAVSGPDGNITFVSHGHNLVDEADGSSGWIGSDLTGTIALSLDARLGALSNYGGPTETVALLPGSPALQAGTPGVTADQRGVQVPAGTMPSIGAFEGIGLLVTNTGDNGGVNPVADAGTGTLRQAIVDAGAAGTTPGLATIAFAIPGSGPHVISATHSLPSVVALAIIDGTTQAGYSGAPLIQIEGTAADGDGLVLGAGSSASIIEGLDISGFASGAGIRVLSGDVAIRGNYLGTDPTGSVAAGNAYGISVGADDSTIGGTAAATGNLISGNLLGGLVIAAVSGTLVEGNLIGTDPSGTEAVGNAQFGIQISDASGTTIGGSASGAGNTIAATKVLAGSPTSGWGIEVDGVASSGLVIEGDTIGGLPGMGNAGVGISDDLATIVIGGTLAGEGNVIAYNGGAGIDLASIGSADSRVRQNHVIGNIGGGISIGASGPAYAPPVLTAATIVGGVLKVKGSALPGAVLEFYVAGSGQGTVYLVMATEGSLADNDPTAGSFDFALAIPAGVTATAGDSITAISVATPISPTNPSLQDTTSTFSSAGVSDSGPAFGGPAVNAGGGGTIVAGSNFTSQGSFTDTTSASWTATVNYGDGTGTHALSINPISLTAGDSDEYSEVASATFNLSHVFAAAGTYDVVVNVTNDSGQTGTSDFVVTVVAAPPTVNNTDIRIAPASNPSNFTSPTIISENQSVVLTGKFTDANPGTTHTVNIIWGDNSTSTATVDEAAGTFTATHLYRSPGTLNSASGIYTVEVAVDSSAGTSAATTFGLFYVQVNDVPPSDLTLKTDQSTIGEDGTVHLRGCFQAPGPIDAHVVTIDWGDKSPTTTIDLVGGVLNFAGIAHQYLDYAPGAAGTPYTISVSVNDLYQPLSPARATTAVLVNPVAPTQVILTPSHGSITEGQSITLSGAFVAPGPLDHHVVSINWGDGTKPTTVALAAGMDGFAGISHTYANNSIPQPGGAFAITATITDPARPASAGVGTTSVVVDDIAPTVSNLVVTFVGGKAIPVVAQPGVGPAPQVNGGTTVELLGSYTTPNPGEAYSLLVSWGDGTASTIPVASFSTHTFTASHLFADRALGTLLDDIHVTVADAESTTGSGDLHLAVAHVNPVEQIASGGISGGSQVLAAQTTGGDASPITSFTWTVTALNGPFSQSYTTPSVALPSTPNTDYLVHSTETDSLGAISQTFTAVVHVLDDTSSTYDIPDPGAGVDAVIVSGLSGDHTIDGSSLSVPIVFDGDGQETFIGDDADDVFNLHTDQSKAVGNGGNNVFNLTPNCTLFAVANGGQNTLNFSSSTYGVTFDLTQTSGQIQDVDPVAAPGDHFVSVAAQGGATFSTLVDSGGGGDTITAASNTNIVGMGGSNKVLVNSSAANPVGNVTIQGAADGDTLIATGPSIGNINFQGDSGTDTITNMGTVTGAVTFLGGADSGTFNNMGAIAGSVAFGAGSDGGTFNNTGSVTGTLTFGGSSDASTLINNALTNASGATLGSVIFTGDQGANTLTNNGTITGFVVYNGGADGDQLVNAAGASVGSITFNGGADSGTLTNNGMVTGSVTYNGGGDAGTLVNNGVVGGTVTYGGGSDSDSFTNAAGASVGSIVFTGGSDAGTLTNNGTVTGSVTYNGGGDAGTLTNNGAITGGVIYTGGADAGALTNNGTIIGGVSYTGGSDADSFLNQGLVVGSVTYTGGADAGSFTNGGTVTGTVTYTGGSDSDTFTNNGTLGTVVYTGGSDAGTLTNNGAFGTINYTGGSDSDTLINTATGTLAGTVNFQGDTGVDQLINLGTLAGVTYTGGSDSDSLLNPGVVTGAIVFNGDSGADLLENGATVNGVFVAGTVGSITFNAGADTDTLLNPGVVTGAIVFQGDSGADLLENGATVNGVFVAGTVGTITFNGGADANTLLAAGTVTGAIVFNGDGNSDLLINQAAGVGSITFNAGGDANVLANSGLGFGTINFQGDTGTDTLINTGSASGGSASTIVFNGGGDSGTLVNTGSGLGSITYNGDQGNSTLINEGSNIAQITFGGGADGGAFLNAGNNVASITFNAGADANVFRNDGTQVGTITYNGDQGSGYFLNNGSATTINYTGGSDTDTLVNNGVVGTSNGGTITGGIIFTGDTGADGLLNTAAGTINGLVFTGGSDAGTLDNYGTLINASVNFQGDDGAGQFTNQLGGTASNVIYNAGSDADAFINYGSLSNATYIGDIGAGSMYLDGTLNQGITYNGGADGDELIIGPDAGVVSTINFNGDGGTDLLANEANGAQNITFQAGSDTANFWNFADNVNGLTFFGGPGTDTFSNSGSGVTGIVFDARGDSGTDSLYNSGDNVGTIAFTGGSDTNTLVNSGASTASITYNAGSDSDTLTNIGSGVQSITFNGDDGVCSLVNSGSNVGSITYNGGSDSDSLTNSGTVGTITFNGDGPSATFTDSGAVGTLVFDGGAGSASLIYSAVGAAGSSVTFTCQDGGNIFIDSGSAGSVTVNLGSGNNQAVVVTGATGNIELIGGAGDNTYLFSGTPTAQVTVDQALFASAGTIGNAGGTTSFAANLDNPKGSGGGIDTLDFSGYTGGGIALDLMNTAPQALTGGLMLTLTDPEGISGVVGTPYGDRLSGNLRPDVISTADLPDFRLAGQTSPAAAPAFTADARTQWVYLDFDSYTVAGDHVYNSAERAAILARIQMDYYGPDPSNPNLPDFANPWFDVQITDNLRDIPSNLAATGQYATLYFNRTPPSGLPGGEASEVDLGNTDFGGYASIQINGMVDGGGQPPSIDPVTGADNFAILSAKIGAHELAHLMGVRHSDAFGPIGFGVHTPPGTTEFNPNFDGADAAFETFDHLISSPATVGTSRFNDLRDLDFGPREAIKLAFASKGTTIVAPTGSHSAMASAEPISLAPLTVPNTDVVLADVEKGMNFQVASLDVQGTIGIDPRTGLAAPDYYAITGQKGDVDTFEVDSQELGRLGGQDIIDSVLTVYDASGKVIAFNDDQYEGTDSLLLDVTLPATGTYYIKVTSFAAPAGDPEYDPTNPQSPLNPGNLDSILNPLNPNFSQSALTNFLDAKAGTATGQYDLFIYRFAEASPTAADVRNVLVARGAGTTLSGSTGTDILIGPAGTLFDDSDGGPGNAISIAAAVANPSVDLLSHFQDVVTLTGPTGSIPWNVTISYGDGSAPTVEQVASGSVISLDHLYQATGNDTVTLEIQTGAGTFETSVSVSVILAQAPTEAITGPAAGARSLVNLPVSFSGSLQSPYVGVNYLASWTFTNVANPAQVLTTSQTVSTPSATNSLAFSTSETFTTPGTYSVQLSITDLANGTATTVQTVDGSPSQVIIFQFIVTTTTVAAPNTTYNGKTYGLAMSQVVGTDQNVLAAPTVTYTYYRGTDTGLTSPMSFVPTDAGSYLVVATFAGNSTYFASTSQSVVFTIGQAPLTVTIADASKVYGANDAASLMGSIAGIQNNDSIASSFASTGSAATADMGTYSITASLSGAATILADYAVTFTNSAGTKTSGTLTVSPDRTTTQVTSASGSSNAGTPVTFTATVANSDSGSSPLGTLVFFDGITDLGYGTLVGSAGNQTTWTFTTSTLSPGTHGITASFTPTPLANGADFLTNNSQVAPFSEVVRGGTTTTTASASSTTSFYGQAETFTATVLVGSTPATGTVDFFDSATNTDLGSATLNSSGVATLPPGVPLPAGTQSIAASYAGGNGFTASSTAVSVVVKPSIYVLNATAIGALSLSGSATITISGLVQVDSSSSSAIQESGNTKTTASAIRVVGGYSATGSSGFSTTPVKDSASVPDPLLALPIPQATGLASYAAVNLGGNLSQTINPGIYPAINVTGSAKLKMNPGLYVITGGGFSVNGAAGVTGSGVVIYNAGSNFNGGSGGSYGGFTISGSGTVNLSAPTSGPFAGILLFQSRDNTRAASLSGAAVVALNGGVIYAPAALLNLSGSAQLGASGQPTSPLIVNELLFTGTGASDLTAGGAGDSPDLADQLLAGDVSIYVDDTFGAFTADELARIQDAVASADATVAPYGVDVSEVTDPSLATTIITISPTSLAGSASDGVLGCESPGAIALVSGWNWYTGSDPGQVGPDQYDFETIVLHEIGHSMGLGHSQDPTSVMFTTLDTGQAKRSLVTADLDIPDADGGPCPLHAATDAGLDLATTTGPDAAPQDLAEGEIPLTPDPMAFGNAGSSPKVETTSRVQRTAPRSPQALVTVASRTPARRHSLHDLALDAWSDEEADWLEGIARDAARKKPAESDAGGSLA